LLASVEVEQNGAEGRQDESNHTLGSPKKPRKTL